MWHKREERRTPRKEEVEEPAGSCSQEEEERFTQHLVGVKGEVCLSSDALVQSAMERF